MGKKYKDREAIIVDFSKRLRKERKRLKMTQKQLADEIGVDIKTIGNWEQCNTLPKKLDDALAICNLFECDIDYLFGRQKEKTKTATDICEATGLKAEAVNVLLEKKDIPQIVGLISHLLTHENYEEIARRVHSERGLVGYINFLKKKGIYERLKKIYESTKTSVSDVGVTPKDTEDLNREVYLSLFREKLLTSIRKGIISKEEEEWLGLDQINLEEEEGEEKKYADVILMNMWDDFEDDSNIQRDYWVISNLFLDVIKSYLQLIAFTEEEVIEVFLTR